MTVESDRWDIIKGDDGDANIAVDLERDIGTEAMYARLNYLMWSEHSWLHDWIDERVPDTPRDKPEQGPVYLEIEKLPMPELAKPKPKKKRLSTGESPVRVVTTPDGNTALALLANAVATGAILVVLITMFGPISGAHFNPAVTINFMARREISVGDSVAYIAAQVVGGVAGV